jgi:uncharacterized membrane protein HdeD (DUF308 family)
MKPHDCLFAVGIVFFGAGLYTLPSSPQVTAAVLCMMVGVPLMISASRMKGGAR